MVVNLEEIKDKKKFCKQNLKIDLDKWQLQLLEEKDRNVAIRAGRQVGKSFGVALKAFFYAIENNNKTVLIVAASQRQSSLLFEKIKGLIQDVFPDEIKEVPTMTKIILKNGTKIYSLPAGRTGYSIRGFSIDLLIADEAAFIPESVWVALIPMLAVTKGKLILLSTPFGKGGFFFSVFGDSDYKHFHLNSEECPRIPKEFLKKEKSRLSKIEYAQEYLGEFIEEFNCYFPSSLIKERCTIMRWNYNEDYNPNHSYYLGVDVARYGGDENAFVVVEMIDKDHLRVVKIMTTERISLAMTIAKIMDMDTFFKFKKIFIDDQGVGAGVTDVLIEKLGRRVEGLNNSSKSIDKEGKKRTKLLKEDLYSNLLVLMENKKIEMINMAEIKRSMMSIVFEYTNETSSYRSIRISGNYSHITEALVRAAWCVKTKGLNIYLS